MIYYSDFKVPLLNRTFLIAKNEKGVCYIALDGNENKLIKSLKAYLNDEIIKSKDKLKKEIKQIKEYFAGNRKNFDLKVFLRGTRFQTKAWLALAKVKYGETISYSELAKRAGNKNAVRAAAACCASNPVAIIIPCHRIISKDGSLGGFGGGIDMKRKMLKLERAV